MVLVLYIIVDQEVRDSPALRPIETERLHAQDPSLCKGIYKLVDLPKIF